MEQFANFIRMQLPVDNLHGMYDFNPTGAILDAAFLPLAVQQEILEQPNSFEKNVLLKRFVNQHIGEDPFPSLFWIVRRWGGIYRFSDVPINRTRIESLRETLANNFDFSNELFGRISSLSKIASFLEPTNYAIYDARAIYTLNWLISGMRTEHEDFNVLFFPMKQYISRNAMIRNAPFQLIYDRHVDPQHYGQNNAFYAYCSLLQQVTPFLFPDHPDEIFRTEMLLFASVQYAYDDLI